MRRRALTALVSIACSLIRDRAGANGRFHRSLCLRPLFRIRDLLLQRDAVSHRDHQCFEKRLGRQAFVTSLVRFGKSREGAIPD